MWRISASNSHKKLSAKDIHASDMKMPRFLFFLFKCYTFSDRFKHSRLNEESESHKYAMRQGSFKKF